ncbi:hypothetical protein K488DRAFT_92431 [Vararia minispora EC-137]|uniref:Uncharacterized protein n=1 Tax=Vararia minispora EC-137 TaxID=1314806 RepID=A0ACB8Q4H2_9AGAM|nr:hypothetical protein K488DRAFT_92431 [Vararia minispora EC-137]
MVPSRPVTDPATAARLLRAPKMRTVPLPPLKGTERADGSAPAPNRSGYSHYGYNRPIYPFLSVTMPSAL